VDHEHGRIELPYRLLEAGVKDVFVASRHRSEDVLISRELVERLLVKDSSQAGVGEVCLPHQSRKALCHGRLTSSQPRVKARKLGSLGVGQAGQPSPQGVLLTASAQTGAGEVYDSAGLIRVR
jgi:hypothetical protein